MKFTRFALIVPVTALLALSLSVPASAGQRGQSGDRRSAGERQGSRAPDSGQAQPRSRQPEREPQVQTQRPSAPAPQAQNLRREPPAPQTLGPRGQASPRVAPQGQGPRIQDGARIAPQPQRYSQQGVQDRRYGSPLPYGNSRPVYRPYYSFRPRVSLGFGLYLGYPVSFPSWYDPYQPGYYSYYRPGVSYGGISFDIDPYDTAVYVDGRFMGIAADFSSAEPPLTLTAGRHRIDLEGRGFQRMSFDVNIVPRQVIPYQGTLGRY